jgi:hypothetical protein
MDEKPVKHHRQITQLEDGRLATKRDGQAERNRKLGALNGL